MGDPACWSHLGDAGRPDIRGRHDIEMLMRDFYRQALMDDLLGPIFEREIVDWHAHIDLVTEFWAGQLLGSDGYRGHPIRAHEAAHAATPFTHQHFERWLSLFTDAVDSRHSGELADLAIHRAHRIATAMERMLTRPHSLRVRADVDPRADDRGA